MFAKLIAYKDDISKSLFVRLFIEGIQLISKLKSSIKGALMSVSYRLLQRKILIVETINETLKNIAQVEYSKHRSVFDTAVNLLGTVDAYCFFPKKAYILVARDVNHQLMLFLYIFVELPLFRGTCLVIVLVFLNSLISLRLFAVLAR